MTKIFRVRPSILRMRQQPSADASVIERLQAQQAVVRLRDTDPDPWWFVFADVAGRGIYVGYVHSDYLTPVLLPGQDAGTPPNGTPSYPEPPEAGLRSAPGEEEDPQSDTGSSVRGGAGNAGLGAPAVGSVPVPKDWVLPADRGPRASAARTSGEPGSRTFALGEAGRPPYPSEHPEGAAAGIVAILRWLDCGDSRHLRWKPAEGKTFCNIYTYDVSYLCGVYLPRVWWNRDALRNAQGEQPQQVKIATERQPGTVAELNANALYDWLEEFGEVFGWTRHSDINEAQEAANAGRLAIISAKRRSATLSGHINVIAPEYGSLKAKRENHKVTLPLQSNAGKSNYTIAQTPTAWWKAEEEFKAYGFWSAAPK